MFTFYNTIKMELSRTAISFAFIVFCNFLASVSSYSITVDAHAEECFFETVEADTKMGKLYKTIPITRNTICTIY